MMLRTVLLVTVLAAAAFAFAPSALATPIPELVEITPLVPTGDSLLPPLNVSVHGEVQADIVPMVQVAGGASVTVGSEEMTTDAEEPAMSTQGDSSADTARGATDGGASGPAASIATATAAVGLLATLAFGLEAVRSAASSVWTHAARITRGAFRIAFWLTLLPAVWIPLFSRIARTDLLENPVRASIHAAVTENPGLSLTEVQSSTGIAWGTAVHHLQRLEKNGMVVSATQRGHRRYFVTGSPAALRRDDIAVMVHPTARRIASLVSVQPGIDQTGICQKLGLNNPAASKHLRGFEAQGLVLAHRDGRKRLYHPTPSLDAALPFVQSSRMEAAVQIRQPAIRKASVAASG